MTPYGHKNGKELSFTDMEEEVKSVLENNQSGQGLKIEEINNNLKKNGIDCFNYTNLASILNKLINKDEIRLSSKDIDPIDILFFPKTHYQQ